MTEHVPSLVRTFRSALLIAGIASSTVSAQTPRYPAPQDMQTVHVVLLKKGPNSGTGTAEEQAKIQAAHIAHLESLGKAGHGLIAGPMAEDGDLRGIILMKAASADEARALEAEDPAVKAGRLTIDVVSYMTPGNWFNFLPIKEVKMRPFVYGYLKKGPNFASLPASEMPKLQDDHLANLWAMREAGALVAAGPAVNAGDIVGVVIFALDSVDKGRALLEQDPGVKAGRFAIELHPWFAADGILKGK